MQRHAEYVTQEALADLRCKALICRPLVLGAELPAMSACNLRDRSQDNRLVNRSARFVYRLDIIFDDEM